MAYYHLKAYPSLPSTNDLAKELAKKNANEWTAILSSRQTKGKGRRQNVWHSPPGGMYLSIVLYPSHAKRMQLLTFAAALSVLHAIQSEYSAFSIKPSIKWPNDILLGDKKICGILTETLFGERMCSIVGIGLNLNQERFPQPLKETAASLLIETKKKTNAKKMAKAIIETFSHYYTLFNNKKYSKILNEWKKHCITLNKKVNIISVKNTFSGKAMGVDEEGMLKVKLPNGRIKIVMEGDVSVR